jgi:hypothetical protein
VARRRSHQRRNPVGVVIFSRRLTQGGSFLPPSLRYGAARATLGFEAESLWDSWTVRLVLQETEMRPCAWTAFVLSFVGNYP